MKITILDKTKKKRFIEGAGLGLKRIRELLIRTGQESIRAYSGNLSTEEIMAIWRILPIEGIGLYVGKDMMNRNGIREVRLSVDALHSLKDQISEDIIVLNKEQEKEWFFGRDVELSEEQAKNFKNKKSFVAVKSNDGNDFIGTGKIGNGGGVLFNYLPKERRRKSQTL